MMLSTGTERWLMEARQRVYRMTDIAAAAGRSHALVCKHARESRFNPDSLLSVARYIAAADLARLSKEKDFFDE